MIRGVENSMSPSLANTDTKLPDKKPAVTESQIHFEPLLDTQEAAALLGIHPKTLQRLARAGKVPSVRIGKSWAFRASALDKWLTTKLAS
jgi:excisionase family DNA binding protein